MTCKHQSLLFADTTTCVLCGMVYEEGVWVEKGGDSRKRRIALHSGHYLDLANPVFDYDPIKDIAHGLSQICRWAGQCNRFYSVAEHSVLCSKVFPTKEMLLHDAPEAFIGDFSRPLKWEVPGLSAVESKIWDALALKMGLKSRTTEKIKEVDDFVLLMERPQLFPWMSVEQKEIPELFTLEYWTPEEAKQRFLKRWYEINASAGGFSLYLLEAYSDELMGKGG